MVTEIFSKWLPAQLFSTVFSVRHTPGVGEVYQSMSVARQTIAEIMTFRKFHKVLLERRATAYRSRRKKHPKFRNMVEFVHHGTQVTDILDEALNAIMCPFRALFLYASVRTYSALLL
jgi:hypothetical protein